MYRTYQPWGHVSRADRAFRHELAARIVAQGRLDGDAAFVELATLLRGVRSPADLTPAAKRRVNALCDDLNARGHNDREIGRALEAGR